MVTDRFVVKRKENSGGVTMNRYSFIPVSGKNIQPNRAQCKACIFSRQQNGQHLTGCAYIHCSKSPKISFPILTWLHFPLLKCVLYHLLFRQTCDILSYLDRKVVVVFYILPRNCSPLVWNICKRINMYLPFQLWSQGHKVPCKGSVSLYPVYDPSISRLQ